MDALTPRLSKVVEDLVKRASRIAPMIRMVKFRIGKAKDFPKKRDMAWCEPRPLRVTLAPKLEDAERNVQKGVIAHELGHALLFIAWDLDHTEKEADLAAELLIGRPIRYNKDNIQTIGPGKSPRPSHLPK